MVNKKKHGKRYPTDLNDRKWDLIQDLLPAALPGGRPPHEVRLRKIVNAILYITRGELCQATFAPQ